MNPNVQPRAEAQVLSQEDTLTNIGLVAIDGAEDYISPAAVAEVSADAVTLGAVRGFEQEQTSGYKPMP